MLLDDGSSALARYRAERGADLAPCCCPPPEGQRELAAGLTRREELVALCASGRTGVSRRPMRVAETNRSRQLLYADPPLARSVEAGLEAGIGGDDLGGAMLATLNSEIATLQGRDRWPEIKCRKDRRTPAARWEHRHR